MNNFEQYFTLFAGLKSQRLIKLFLPICLLWIVIFAAVFSLYGQEARLKLIQQSKQWFEWGEYSLIIQNLPAFISDTAMQSDSIGLAKLQTYLGVAFFACGEIGKARDAFGTAYIFDSTVYLEKEYVSQEIKDFFTTTIQEKKQYESEQKEKELILQQNQRITLENRVVIDSLDKTVKRTRSRMIYFGAVSTAIACIGFAGVSAYEYLSAEEEYEKFLSASLAGDFVRYHEHKEKIHRYDTGTFLFAAGSILSAISSVSLFVTAGTRRKKQDTTMNHNVKMQWNGIGLVLLFK